MSVNPNRLPELPSLPPEHYAVFRQRIRDRQGWKLLLTLVVAPIAIWLLIVLLLSLRSDELNCALRRCDENPTGPSLLWAEQLAVAQMAAKKEDEAAVLLAITAEPVAEWPRTWTYSDTLEVRFDYALSRGGKLWITLHDSSPATTVKVERYEYDLEDSNPLYWQVHQDIMSMQEESITRAARIQLAPREAVALTWDEAVRTEAFGNRLAPYIRLSIVNRLEPSAVMPDSWQVNYWYVPRQTPSSVEALVPRLCFDCPQSYAVDIETGEIHERAVNGIVLSAPLP
jgi:hypothetical protein